MAEKRIVAIAMGDTDPHSDGDNIVFSETELSKEEIEKVYDNVVKQWDGEADENGDLINPEAEDHINLGDVPRMVAEKIGTIIEIESHRRDI